MDHGISNGPIEGLENPTDTIYKCEGHGSHKCNHQQRNYQSITKANQK